MQKIGLPSTPNAWPSSFVCYGSTGSPPSLQAAWSADESSATLINFDTGEPIPELISFKSDLTNIRFSGHRSSVGSTGLKPGKSRRLMQGLFWLYWNFDLFLGSPFLALRSTKLHSASCVLFMTDSSTYQSSVDCYIMQAIEMVLNPLRTIFQERYPRNGEHDEAWHSSFESFLAALAERRKGR